MKTFLTTITFFVITLTISVYGQTKENDLPDEYIGGWAVTPEQCEVSSLLNISRENDKLEVYGYEWRSDEAKVTQDKDYYVLLIKASNMDGNWEMNLRIKIDGENLILDNESFQIIGGGEPSDINKLIRCK